MRGFLSVTVVAGLVVMLCSCSIVDRLQNDVDRAEQAHAQATRLVEAISSGEPEMLKAELSNRVVLDDANIDEDIARVYELLPDGVWSWRERGCSEGSSSHAGPVEVYLHCSYDIVLDSSTPVSMYFIVYTYNTWDTENVGVYALSVTTGDDAPPRQENDTPWEGPGIYVSDSPPVVGGRP